MKLLDPSSLPLAVVLPWSGMVPKSGPQAWDTLGAAVQYRPPGVTVTPAPAPGGVWWLLELLGCSRWGGRASGIQ